MMRCWCGIDIGKEGGIAVIYEDKTLKYWPMPLTGEEDSDFNALLAILKDLPDECHVLYEKLHAIYMASSKTTYQLARQATIVECAVFASKKPYSCVVPTKWQKVLFENQKPVFKLKTVMDGKGKKSKVEKLDTKAVALIVAKKMYPNEKFLATPRSRVASNGIVDAIMLAEYARRKNL